MTDGHQRQGTWDSWGPGRDSPCWPLLSPSFPCSLQGLHQVRSALPGGLAAVRKEMLLLLGGTKRLEHGPAVLPQPRSRTCCDPESERAGACGAGDVSGRGLGVSGKGAGPSGTATPKDLVPPVTCFQTGGVCTWAPQVESEQLHEGLLFSLLLSRPAASIPRLVC